jgi:hypothetical protein
MSAWNASGASGGVEIVIAGTRKGTEHMKKSKMFTNEATRLLKMEGRIF